MINKSTPRAASAVLGNEKPLGGSATPQGLSKENRGKTTILNLNLSQFQKGVKFGKKPPARMTDRGYAL
jgi:hypothetical protein